MNILATISSPEFFQGLLSLLITVLILSYVVGDNVAFRLAIHAFIGVAAGYITAIVVLQVIVNKIAYPLVFGGMTEKILASIPLVLGLLLLLKLSPSAEWVARPIVAFLVGTGAAAAVAGAMLGTIYPQTLASIASITTLAPTLDLSKIVQGAFILVGTVSTLAYFQFTVLGKSAADGKRGWLMTVIAFLGQVFIAVTLGALFAGAFSAALTALIDRIQSIVLFIDKLFS
jgi:hypothetical protein